MEFADVFLLTTCLWQTIYTLLECKSLDTLNDCLLGSARFLPAALGNRGDGLFSQTGVSFLCTTFKKLWSF